MNNLSQDNIFQKKHSYIYTKPRKKYIEIETPQPKYTLYMIWAAATHGLEKRRIATNAANHFGCELSLCTVYFFGLCNRRRRPGEGAGGGGSTCFLRSLARPSCCSYHLSRLSSAISCCCWMKSMAVSGSRSSYPGGPTRGGLAGTRVTSRCPFFLCPKSLSLSLTHPQPFRAPAGWPAFLDHPMGIKRTEPACVIVARSFLNEPPGGSPACASQKRRSLQLVISRSTDWNKKKS